MPVYEYVCDACGHEFEEFARSMSPEDVVTCPKCVQRLARRKLSVFAFRAGEQRRSGGSMSGPCGRCGDPDGPCSA
jgi:putative FmdB family regulatory protein